MDRGALVTGRLGAVDVTPQHTEAVETEVRQQRDPLNVTEVRPEAAEEVVPPDPVQQESPPTTTPIPRCSI